MTRSLIAFGCLMTLAVMGSLFHTSQTASAAGPPFPTPVNIAGPLPVPVSIAGAVSGTVSSTQSGPWSVGLTGNSPDTPLFVREPATIDPANYGTSCVFEGVTCVPTDSYVIPDGRLLEIDYVWAHIVGLAAGGSVDVCLTEPLGDNQNTLCLTTAAAPGGLTAFTTGGLVRRYRKPGQVRFSLTGNGVTSSTGALLGFSGRLTPLQ